jgi:hypothetical protein
MFHERKFMRRALLALIVLAAGIAPVSAATLKNPQAFSDDLVSEAVAVAKPQPPADIIKTSATPSVQATSVQGNAQGSSHEGSGWHSLGTVLATLVLIGAIAARRYSAQKP